MLPQSTTLEEIKESLPASIRVYNLAKLLEVSSVELIASMNTVGISKYYSPQSSIAHDDAATYLSAAQERGELPGLPMSEEELQNYVHRRNRRSSPERTAARVAAQTRSLNERQSRIRPASSTYEDRAHVITPRGRRATLPPRLRTAPRATTPASQAVPPTEPSEKRQAPRATDVQRERMPFVDLFSANDTSAVDTSFAPAEPTVQQYDVRAQLSFGTETVEVPLPPEQKTEKKNTRSSRIDDEQDAQDEQNNNGQQQSGPKGGQSHNDDQNEGEQRARRRRRGRRGKGRGRTDEATEDNQEQNASDSAFSSDTQSENTEKDEKNQKGQRSQQSQSQQQLQSGKDAKGAKDSPATQSAQEGKNDDHKEDSAEDTSTTRRRRRRRRSDNQQDNNDKSSDDPENTVIHERSSRQRSNRTSNKVRGVAGSSRLEAKRQRRREGRINARNRVPVLSEAEFLARRESVERTMVIREKSRSDHPGKTTQIGVLEDNILAEHFVTSDESASMVGNVYLGRVQSVLPSMEAAFVDIGGGRSAILYAGEINWAAAGLGGKSRCIENAISRGDMIPVQVLKDPIAHKGARLTTMVSLAGRYLVYVPDGNTSGISRKLPDSERKRLRAILKKILPEDAGVIIRTAAENATEEDLQRDISLLHEQWEQIKNAVEVAQKKADGNPRVLYEEPTMLIKVVRDLFNDDFSRMVVEGDHAWNVITTYIDRLAPHLRERMERWENTGVDVFQAFRVDEQLEKALQRKVWLPSGGSLVIDRTEAMTVIDVNTGKFVGSGGSLEETVTKNNLEAAEEIVRQLRLRDIGGIIVIDFVDMVLEANRDLVLRRLCEALGRDRTRHQVTEVTSLGLVQMTRQRLGTGLLESFSTKCPHCHGDGYLLQDDPVEEITNGMNLDDSRRGRRRRHADHKNAKNADKKRSHGKQQQQQQQQNDKRSQKDAQKADQHHGDEAKNQPSRSDHPAVKAMERKRSDDIHKDETTAEQKPEKVAEQSAEQSGDKGQPQRRRRRRGSGSGGGTGGATKNTSQSQKEQAQRDQPSQAPKQPQAEKTAAEEDASAAAPRRRRRAVMRAGAPTVSPSEGGEDTTQKEQATGKNTSRRPVDASILSSTPTASTEDTPPRQARRSRRRATRSTPTV